MCLCVWCLISPSFHAFSKELWWKGNIRWLKRSTWTPKFLSNYFSLHSFERLVQPSLHWLFMCLFCRSDTGLLSSAKLPPWYCKISVPFAVICYVLHPSYNTIQIYLLPMHCIICRHTMAKSTVWCSFPRISQDIAITFITPSMADRSEYFNAQSNVQKEGWMVS